MHILSIFYPLASFFPFITYKNNAGQLQADIYAEMMDENAFHVKKRLYMPVYDAMEYSEIMLSESLTTK